MYQVCTYSGEFFTHDIVLALDIASGREILVQWTMCIRAVGSTKVILKVHEISGNVRYARASNDPQLHPTLLDVIISHRVQLPCQCVEIRPLITTIAALIVFCSCAAHMAPALVVQIFHSEGVSARYSSRPVAGVFCGAQDIKFLQIKSKPVMANLDIVHDLLANHLPVEAACLELQRIFGKTVTMEVVQERRDKLVKYRAQLEVLKKIPVVEQRSQEWYDMRLTMMTASDLAQALGKGKFASQKDFYIKKSGYVEQTFDFTIPPMKHGTMFEPVANSFYENLMSTKVHEFGLLKHPELEWFGASPDGVTDNGVMLEIKCPYRRKIDGTVPEQYYMQICGQMDVAGLDECDYLECIFREYQNEESFLGDQGGLPGLNMKGQHIGIVLESRIGQGPFVYKYSPWGLSAKDAVLWANDKRASKPEFNKSHFWYLEKFNIARIYKDSDFIEKQLELAADVWNKVLHFRNNKESYDMFMNGIGGPPCVTRVSRPLKSVAAVKRMKQTDLTEYAFLDD